MGIDLFLARSDAASSTECLYLQQALLAAQPDGRLGPPGPLGPQLMSDLVSVLNG